MRLTDDRTAECLRANNEKLRKAGYEVDPASERYVRLADYERIAQTPEELREYIANANTGKYRKILVNAINAHREMIFVSEYDRGFHYGMEHALYLLDQMCRDEWERVNDEASR